MTEDANAEPQPDSGSTSETPAAPESAPTTAPRRALTAREKEAIAARKRENDEKRTKAKAEKEAKRAAAAEDERQLDEAKCGPSPDRSAWDGIYLGLKDAVKSIAHDPDSVSFQECQPLKRNKAPICWATRCRWRAKNALGALRLTTSVFAKNNNGWAKLGDED